MPNFAKPFNRVLFVVCVVVTGALAGAFVWLFFFLMGRGIGFLWSSRWRYRSRLRDVPAAGFFTHRRRRRQNFPRAWESVPS